MSSLIQDHLEHDLVLGSLVDSAHLGFADVEDASASSHSTPAKTTAAHTLSRELHIAPNEQQCRQQPQQLLRPAELIHICDGNVLVGIKTQ